MPHMLSVYINGKKVLEHEKNPRVPGQQRRFLDSMDLDMDEGIELNGEVIDSPDKMQRANYVAMSLFFGIENKSEGMVSVACNYLSNRLPELKQIRATDLGEEVSLDFIYTEVN